MFDPYLKLYKPPVGSTSIAYLEVPLPTLVPIGLQKLEPTVMLLFSLPMILDTH